MSDLFLGLDLGTTNCKALVCDGQGQVVARAAAATPTLPASGAESPMYDAHALWDASLRLIRQVLAGLGPGQRIAALAVASMGEAGVLLDAAGEPLAPVLTWHDRRTVPWIAWWRARVGDTAIYQRTGLPLDYIYSASKLLWHRSTQPDLFRRATSWLCLADWITYCLTGAKVTSYSMASRTMLFDVAARRWSDELLAAAGLSADLLPVAVPSGRLAGQVTAAAAAASGLAAGTPVVTAGHDHICAALAAGVFDPGPVLDSSGTMETLLSGLAAPALSGASLTSGLGCGCHTAGDRYYLVGGVMSGAIVGWLGTLFGAGSDPAALEALLAQAAEAPPLANGLWFLPHLGGSGPPDRDPNAWGAWLGLRLGHTRGDALRAAMEGVCYAVRALLEGHQTVTGWRATELRTVGGSSRNAWWQGLKADVLGLPVEVPAVSDLTALGAALLAGIGGGYFADAGDAARRSYRPARRFEPDAERHALYDRAYRDVYAGLYPALRRIALDPQTAAEGPKTT